LSETLPVGERTGDAICDCHVSFLDVDIGFAKRLTVPAADVVAEFAHWQKRLHLRRFAAGAARNTGRPQPKAAATGLHVAAGDVVVQKLAAKAVKALTDGSEELQSTGVLGASRGGLNINQHPDHSWSRDDAAWGLGLGPRQCHRRVSGARAVRRYGSGRIEYRAMYVRIGNPVVCSIDRT
jgi:hypothetical protein